MTNKQRTFVNSGLELTLFFLTLGTATSFPLYVVASEVSIAQQTRTVTGMVTDEKGDPLLGVNVVVKGTSNGTVTNLEGKYSLEVPFNCRYPRSFGFFRFICYTAVAG